MVKVMRPKCPLNMNSTFPSVEFVVVLFLSFSSSEIRELQPVLEEVTVAVQKATLLSVSIQLSAALRACQVSIRADWTPVSREQDRATHLTQVIRPSPDGKELLKLRTNLLVMQISDLRLDASLMLSLP